MAQDLVEMGMKIQQISIPEKPFPQTDSPLGMMIPLISSFLLPHIFKQHLSYN